MTISVLAGLFFVVLAAVTAAGYLLVLRPARMESTQPALPASLAYDQGDRSSTQAALVDLLRLLGEMVPVRGGQEEVRQQLHAAGFRWPSAVAIFLGIKAMYGLYKTYHWVHQKIAGRNIKLTKMSQYIDPFRWHTNFFLCFA